MSNYPIIICYKYMIDNKIFMYDIIYMLIPIINHNI